MAKVHRILTLDALTTVCGLNASATPFTKNQWLDTAKTTCKRCIGGTELKVKQGGSAIARQKAIVVALHVDNNVDNENIR